MALDYLSEFIPNIPNPTCKVTKYVKIFSGCLDQSGMGEILLTQFLAEQILARSCMEEGVEFACSTIPLQRDKCR